MEITKGGGDVETDGEITTWVVFKQKKGRIRSIINNIRRKTFLFLYGVF